MKLVTFMKPGEKVQQPPWADLVLRLYINNIRGALLSVYGYPDDILLLRNDVKITDKDAVVKFFSSFKSSASIKYGNQEIGYFLSTRDKNMNSRLIITHYALKV
jgi:RNA recognition motif-containing protein